MVEIVMLLSVCVKSSDHQHHLEIRPDRRHMIVRNTVQIAVEYTRITVSSQKDQSIGERSEPRFDRRRQRLSRLCIVVVDKCHRVDRIPLSERVVKYGPQIISVTVIRGVAEMEMQRNIEKTHLIISLIQIIRQLIDISAPVFTYCENVSSALLPHIFEPFPVKTGVDMLYGIETHAVESGHPLIPGAPFVQLLCDLRHLLVNIRTHQIVEVSVFIIDIRTPFVIFQLVNRTARLVPDTGEVTMIPFEI